MMCGAQQFVQAETASRLGCMVTCTTPPFRAAVRLNSGVMRYLILLAIVLLASCASGRLTPMHNDCGLQPFSWSRISAPPSELESLARNNQLTKTDEHHAVAWFRDNRERILLCRKDRTQEGACGSARTIFTQSSGSWKIDQNPHESVVTVCLYD